MILNSKHQIGGVNRSIEDIFIADKKNAKFKEEFKLLKRDSENQMLFRYLLTGRIGYIKVFLKKEDNKLLIETFQAPLGFGAPIILFFAAIVFFVLYKSPVSLVKTLNLFS